MQQYTDSVGPKIHQGTFPKCYIKLVCLRILRLQNEDMICQAIICCFKFPRCFCFAFPPSPNKNICIVCKKHVPTTPSFLKKLLFQLSQIAFLSHLFVRHFLDSPWHIFLSFFNQFSLLHFFLSFISPLLLSEIINVYPSNEKITQLKHLVQDLFFYPTLHHNSIILRQPLLLDTASCLFRVLSIFLKALLT